MPKQTYLKNYKYDTTELKTLQHKLSRASIFEYSGSKNILEALYIESLNVDSLQALQLKINNYRSSMKKREIERYFEILSELLPQYEKRIWNKSYQKLLNTKEQLLALMTKNNYNDMIETIASFYGVDLAKAGVFDVALYPINSGNNINAYRIKNVETIGVLTHKEQNLKWLLNATILHEISHTLYFKSELVKKYFVSFNKSEKLLITEGLATAIGAGWGYERMTGTLLSNIKWYNNSSYDRYAKILYPYISEYFANNKTLDTKMVKVIAKNL